jgi:hypothetical protein
MAGNRIVVDFPEIDTMVDIIHFSVVLKVAAKWNSLATYQSQTLMAGDISKPDEFHYDLPITRRIMFCTLSACAPAPSKDI